MVTSAAHASERGGPCAATARREALLARITALDERDGRIDGRLHAGPRACEACGRTVRAA